ncbi:MAG: hypothetical protein HQ568_07340 [Calditrichaeota bacterium]|nr:hypothetical protein [Calditrichota bacterium]
MEWLDHLLPGVIGAVGVPLMLYMFGLLLPRERTYEFGYQAGRLLSSLGQRKIGVRKWEKIEDRIQSTAADFINGVNAGLESDDGNK